MPIEYVPGPGLIHGFAAFLGVVDAADRNVSAILELFTRATRDSPGPRDD